MIASCRILWVNYLFIMFEEIKPNRNPLIKRNECNQAYAVAYNHLRNIL